MKYVIGLSCVSYMILYTQTQNFPMLILIHILSYQQASKLDVYASFLQNYPRAVETVRRCSTHSPQFADITRSIKLRSLQGQAQSLEDLLHRPVARVQKNALVLHVSVLLTDRRAI